MINKTLIFNSYEGDFSGRKPFLFLKIEFQWINFHNLENQMGDSVNIKKLKNPEGRSFLDELEQAEENLSKQDAKLFFRTVLSHFDSNISTRNGNAILKTILSLLQKSKIAQVFVDNDFASSLPLSSKNFASSAFAILLHLAKAYPAALTNDSLIDNLSDAIPRTPDKALVVIATFAQNTIAKKRSKNWNSDSDDDQISDSDSDGYNPRKSKKRSSRHRNNTDLDNDFEAEPLFDLLVKHAEIYANNDDLVPPFLSLLALLNDSSSEFRQKRGRKCAKIISLIMESAETPLLKKCYGSLKTYRRLAPSLTLIKRHLKSRALQSSVLSYLVLSPPLTVDSTFLEMLLTIANSDARGSYVLFQIAQKEENAEMLVEDAENLGWLKMSLPTAEDTLKLLLVVFQHKNLRDSVAHTPHFLRLLLAASKKTKDAGVLTVVCTMLRRVTFDRKISAEMKEIGFLATFFSRALDITENMAVHSGLLLADTLARVGFFSDFLEIAPKVCEIAQDGGPLSNVAAQLAVDLAVYPKCIRVLRKEGMESFFKRKLKDQKLKRTAQKFFELLEDGPD
ncbi:hypothetical protein TRFO_05334 [Tritrichomonas foetus]|uniref:Uncharacterized protein n=1 Tax=Tritrichomonas foetus TaxID=1144522 RepID=A0A1J4K6K9_9EUKA|nr:hypothetical protein TRFO_05334 [Tritrichomonas foetus]|eukprot:OHT07105.1 hypothetical protein TRFO_05334 [Tritrichomonas foetus]